MTDDIVTRLRADDCFEFPSCDDVKQEAADEIERLRAEIERLKTPVAFVDEVYILTEEGEKLWDKIKAARGD